MRWIKSWRALLAWIVTLPKVIRVQEKVTFEPPCCNQFGRTTIIQYHESRLLRGLNMIPVSFRLVSLTTIVLNPPNPWKLGRSSPLVQLFHPISSHSSKFDTSRSNTALASCQILPLLDISDRFRSFLAHMPSVPRQVPTWFSVIGVIRIIRNVLGPCCNPFTIGVVMWYISVINNKSKTYCWAGKHKVGLWHWRAERP